MISLGRYTSVLVASWAVFNLAAATAETVGAETQTATNEHTQIAALSSDDLAASPQPQSQQSSSNIQAVSEITGNPAGPTVQPETIAAFIQGDEVDRLVTGPVSVAEVVSSLSPPAQKIPTRFHDVLDANLQSGAAVSQGSATYPEAIFNVPITVTPKVEGHMRFFHTSIRSRFEQWLVRLGRYKKQVEDIFTEFDLPSDLVFLSLVESGFNPHAYSRARATGPWQFMQGTAKVYGLRIDQYVDERRDPIKSTVAAAKYLRDLYDLFGAWPLAMAAYNAGEGKVLRALQKTQAKSFWEIAQTKHLKAETKEYVPRFMAATIIAKNPDRFGFSVADPDPHQFDEVVVERSLHLRDIGVATGVTFDELERLNPELRRSVTPPGEQYHLKVPIGMKTTVESALVAIKTWKGPLPNVKHMNKGKTRSEWYKVRVGDTLQTISKRFRLSVADLKARNHLVNRPILRPGDRLRIGP